MSGAGLHTLAPTPHFLIHMAVIVWGAQAHILKTGPAPAVSVSEFCK